MSSLAFICKEAGYDVAGSDRAESALTDKLKAADIPVFPRHDEKNIEGYDAVVYTGAIHADNPELSMAKRKNLPIIYRATLLGDIMKNYRTRIGVAGMHGKSSATGMISHLFSRQEKSDRRFRRGDERYERCLQIRRQGLFHFRGVRIYGFFPALFPYARRDTQYRT